MVGLLTYGMLHFLGTLTRLLNSINALMIQCRRVKNALQVARNHLDISWAGADGFGFIEWLPFLHDRCQASDEYLGFRAFEAMKAFQAPDAEKAHKQKTALILHTLEDRLVKVTLKYDAATGQTKVVVVPGKGREQNLFCSMYHFLGDALGKTSDAWKDVLLEGRHGFHLLPILPEAAEAREVLRTANRLYMAHCTRGVLALQCLRCLLGLLKCTEPDEYDHRSAVTGTRCVDKREIIKFMAYQESDVLTMSCAPCMRNGHRGDKNPSPSFLRQLSQEAALLQLHSAPSEEASTAILALLVQMNFVTQEREEQVQLLQAQQMMDDEARSPRYSPSPCPSSPKAEETSVETVAAILPLTLPAPDALVAPSRSGKRGQSYSRSSPSPDRKRPHTCYKEKREELLLEAIALMTRAMLLPK